MGALITGVKRLLTCSPGYKANTARTWEGTITRSALRGKGFGPKADVSTVMMSCVGETVTRRVK